MLLTNLKLVAGAIIVVAILGVSTVSYFKGKSVERENCLKEQAKVMQLWQDKVNEAEEQNKQLAKQLSTKVVELDKAKASRVQRIIKYVKEDPSADTIVFDADGLSILNDAQEGRTTNSK